MKKVMSLTMVAMLMLAMGAMAQSVRTDGFAAGTIIVPAGATNAFAADIRVCPENGVPAFRALDEFIVKNVSGTGTGTVYLSYVDIGVETQVMNAGAHEPAYSTISYPRRTASVQSWAGWVVTGGVAIAKATVVSDYVPYNVRRLKVYIAQPASATSNVYWYSIKAK